MQEIPHKYYCAYCQYSICGKSAEALATNLNTHNGSYHPADCTNWTPMGVTLSVHYSGPKITSTELVRRPGPRPEYTRPYGGTSKDEWGGSQPPVLTEADKELLAKGFVKW